MRPAAHIALTSAALLMVAAWPQAQSGAMFQASIDHAAIGYTSRPSHDAIAGLNEQLARGDRRLTFDGPSGYLRSLLASLDIPVSSQTLVFSENSLQRAHISQKTPRAIYFNDTVTVGWAQGSGSIEVAALDASQGVHFYSMTQAAQDTPRLAARRECLQCHLTAETLGVPGLFTSSVLPLSDNRNDYVDGWATDHRTPIEDRWGGWFVTGAEVPVRHLGNVPVLHVPKSYVRAPVAPRLKTVTEALDAAPYPTPHSDVVALLVLNHQTHATNLLTRVGWEVRVAEHDLPGVAPDMLPERVRRAARDAADYLLFLNEAPLPSRVQGASGFAEEFAARGPRDRQNRSLRDFDLDTRLFRYPCSYMIYSATFDALPPTAKRLVYERMWDALSGTATDRLAARLPLAARRAVIEILRDTRKDLPDAFRASTPRP